MGLLRSDPIEKRKLALMRQAKSKNNKFSIGGIEKKGGHAPKPITLPSLKDLKNG
jgi:hypothetical protein